MSVMAELPQPLGLGGGMGQLARLEPWVSSLAEAVEAGQRDRFRMDLALTEAVTNVLMYGKPQGEDDAVRVSARLQGRVVQVTLSDRGSPFDPLAAPLKKPAATLEEAVPGGAGLTLIRSFCDRADYRYADQHNELTLHFHLEEARP
jgi:serine/threonine-protein kinase RsbW